MRELIKILIESPLYWSMLVEERLELLKSLMEQDRHLNIGTSAGEAQELSD
jgi:hypothetical protein